LVRSSTRLNPRNTSARSAFDRREMMATFSRPVSRLIRQILSCGRDVAESVIYFESCDFVTLLSPRWIDAGHAAHDRDLGHSRANSPVTLIVSMIPEAAPSPSTSRQGTGGLEGLPHLDRPARPGARPISRPKGLRHRPGSSRFDSVRTQTGRTAEIQSHGDPLQQTPRSPAQLRRARPRSTQDQPRHANPPRSARR